MIMKPFRSNFNSLSQAGNVAAEITNLRLQLCVIFKIQMFAYFPFRGNQFVDSRYDVLLQKDLNLMNLKHRPLHQL